MTSANVVTPSWELIWRYFLTSAVTSSVHNDSVTLCYVMWHHSPLLLLLLWYYFNLIRHKIPTAKTHYNATRQSSQGVIMGSKDPPPTPCRSMVVTSFYLIFMQTPTITQWNMYREDSSVSIHISERINNWHCNYLNLVLYESLTDNKICITILQLALCLFYCCGFKLSNCSAVVM